ncbi:MAG TPA: hypothetical protein PKI01_11130 [Bacteroidales bacterium]|nr:hypothetical protein [Bacteroidales bacterium]
MKTTLTKIIAAFFLLLLLSNTYGQTPQSFNYQAVARDAAGNVLQSASLGIRVSMHLGDATGPVVYQETFAPITNDFGLFTLAIGTGTVVDGQFDTIAWGKNHYWMQVEMDPPGATPYTDMGTTQLLSVPYALYAETSGDLPDGTDGQTLRNDGTGWVADTMITNNGYNVGIGSTTPSYKLDVLHGGSTGLRVRSSASFSVVDIDAFSGDAALRFAHEGVNQWNMRNVPSTDDLEIFELGGGGSRLTLQNSTGYLGVGTTAPTARLHVEGDARLTGALYDASNSTGTAGQVLSSTGTGTQWVNAVTSYSANSNATTAIASTTVSTGTVTTIVQLTGVPAGTYGVYFSSPLRNSSTSSAGLNCAWAITINDATPSFPSNGVATNFIPASGWTSNYPFGQSGYKEVILLGTSTIELKITYYGTVSSGSVNLSGIQYLRAIRL